MNFFSVIIPTFNRRALCMLALESVLKQTFDDYEIIVVDDGSSDGTREWLSSSQGNIRVVSQDNRGPGAARNRGAKHATGRYFAFLDSDDLWFPWTLASYAEVIHETGSPSFVAGKPLLFHRTPDGAAAGPTQFRAFRDYLASGDEWRWWGVSSFVIRADIFRASEGFVEGHLNGEDSDLALKLGEAPGFVQITSPATFGYREHAGNLMSDAARLVSGMRHVLQSELAGRYPGGPARARERWHIVSRHLRPVALKCLRSGQKAEAWKLYRSTFRWHWALRRWKFLIGFPFATLFNGRTG
jgi:glycosyltransferase involved in cell wall biosynthesis